MTNLTERIMPLTLEQFVEVLSDIGFMAEGEVYDFLDDFPLGKEPTSARRLVQEMLQHNKLTKFQAELMFRGKTKSLVMGNYIVLDRIGRGGMGRVYKARHRRMDRVVALKLLPLSARSSPEAVKRFDQEIRAAARLSHPNIVTAHDADEDDGRYFLVMEYVEGKDLLRVVGQRGPLEIDVALDYVIQAAEGLAYAHAANVLHLDIKPANLLLDPEGTVKILDMGLARLDFANPGKDTSEELIQDGKVMATVDYVSPERADDPKAVDHRADIYSLGCTLYYLLTGRPPYRASSVLKRIRAHRVEPIPPLRSLRPEVPEALDAVYQKMVAKRPEDRQESMQEVIADLRAAGEVASREDGAASSGIVE
jgi:serine/threonine protein kinase